MTGLAIVFKSTSIVVFLDFEWNFKTKPQKLPFFIADLSDVSICLSGLYFGCKKFLQVVGHDDDDGGTWVSVSHSFVLVSLPCCLSCCLENLLFLKRK